MRGKSLEIGKILNGTTMNNPLGSGITQGHFSFISNKNKEEDLKKILDSKEEFKEKIGTNTCQFPQKALVINLSERSDRWEKFQSKNPDLFNRLQTERFEAIKNPDVRKAIFLSHMGCLSDLSENECVLVLEDDCELAQGWYDKLYLAFRDLPDDWDVLIGNHYFFSSINIISDNLAKPEGTASTANFVLYRGTALKKIQFDFGIRDTGLDDIDHFLTSPLTSIINYTVWPMLAREFVSVSDHHQKVRNMEIRVREHSFLFPYIDSDSYYPKIECW